MRPVLGARRSAAPWASVQKRSMLLIPTHTTLPPRALPYDLLRVTASAARCGCWGKVREQRTNDLVFDCTQRLEARVAIHGGEVVHDIRLARQQRHEAGHGCRAHVFATADTLTHSSPRVMIPCGRRAGDARYLAKREKTDITHTTLRPVRHSASGPGHAANSLLRRHSQSSLGCHRQRRQWACSGRWRSGHAIARTGDTTSCRSSIRPVRRERHRGAQDASRSVGTELASSHHAPSDASGSAALSSYSPCWRWRCWCVHGTSSAVLIEGSRLQRLLKGRDAWDAQTFGVSRVYEQRRRQPRSLAAPEHEADWLEEPPQQEEEHASTAEATPTPHADVPAPSAAHPSTAAPSATHTAKASTGGRWRVQRSPDGVLRAQQRKTDAPLHPLGTSDRCTRRVCVLIPDLCSPTNVWWPPAASSVHYNRRVRPPRTRLRRALTDALHERSEATLDRSSFL
jgi:hypothetical protein